MGKYWWQNDEQTSNGQQTAAQQTNNQQSGYWWQEDNYPATVGNNITTRVNTWLKNHDNYVKNYQTRYGSRKFNYEDAYVKDSGSWLDTVSKQKRSFDEEADSILEYMDKNQRYLDKGWMKSVKDTLTSARGAQQSILDNTAADNEWWNNFGSEELVKQYGSAEDAYKYFQRDDGYRKKYSGQNYDAIKDSMMTLAEGEEKDWLRLYQADIFGDTIRSSTGFDVYAAKGTTLDYTDFGSTKRHHARRTSATSIDKYRAASMALYEHNGNEGAFDNQPQYNEQLNIYRTMKDEEFEVLGACIAMDKEHGTNLAEQYIDSIEETLNTRRGTDIGNDVKDIPVVADLYGVVAGLDQFASGIEGLVYDKDYYIASPTQVASGIVRESMADDGPALPDWLGGASIRQGLYDLTTTTANMAPSILASTAVGMVNPGAGAVVGNMLMGASAAGNAYRDVINRGYGKDEAKFYAGAIGASEAILGQLLGGVSKLGGVSSKITKAVAGIDSGLLRFALQYGGKMASEGLEEGLQEILDPILQNAILRADEDINWSEVAYSALLGSLSAGVLELRPTISETRAETALNKQAVQQYGEVTGDLIQEGLESDPKSESYKIAQKYQKQTEGTDGKGGKALTGAQIRNLLAANQEQITPKDMQKIQQAAEGRLTELGQTKDVQKIAELATKWATGQKLTRAEKTFLTTSEYGSRVANELHPKNIASGGFTTDWAENIGTKQVNAAAYNKKTIEAKIKSIVEAMANPEDPNAYKSLESRVEAEEPVQVSDTGKSVIAGTDEEIDLTKPTFKEITEGGSVLEVDGKLVNADNIEYANEDLGYAVKNVGKIENITPETASAVVSLVDMTKPVVAQMNGLDESFTYGFHNYSEEDLKAGLFTGNLTSQQLNDAYKLGQYVRSKSVDDQTLAYKQMRTAADAIAEKAAAEGKEAPKAKKLAITYNHGNGVIEDIETAMEKLGELTDEQRGGIEVAKILHQMGIGTDFELFISHYSETLKDKNGNPLEVFIDDAGQEQAAYAGVYMAADGKIRINLNAYSGTKGLTLNALSHELTHFIKTWSLEKYNAMADFLVKSYGEKGVSMRQLVLKEQARLKGIRGQEVGYTEAYDEVVANAFNRMLEDGKVMERIAELRKVDKSLADKIIEGIRNFIKRFTKLYQKNESLFMETEALMEMKEVFEQLQNMFAEALVDASDNFQASRITETEAIESLGENAKVEKNADGDLLLASNEKGNVLVYSEQTYLNGGRDKLEMALRQNGHTAEEIKKTLSYVDDALDYIKILAAGYAKTMGYTNLSDHLVADIVTNVKTGKQVMSAIVNNGDYPVNIDLSLICKKRVAYMNLMSRLIQDGVFDKVNYDGAAIAEVNEILRENGFETACLGCFVESRRLQFQTWAETIVSEWNAEVEKRNPNAEEFGFAKGKMEELTDADINALTRELESVKKNDQGNVNLGQGNSVTRMGRLLDALPSLQKKLTVEDLLTPEGLTALRKHDGSLFSIVKSRYGAASPKIVQDFNPYAGEIAMLTFAQVKGITNNAVKGAQAYVKEVKTEYGKLKRSKGESKSDFNERKKDHEQRIQDEAMRRYLYDIGGARIQSFSDFMIENVFDYIQIFADLAAKRLPLHGYTKEIVCMRLFGMTGAKWNGSLIAHVERSMGKESAGLLPAGTKDGIPVSINGKDYVIGFDDYARNAATGGKTFIQSIGMKDIIALQLDPRYAPYVGNITIGVSDMQILAMLDSPLFRMVIPYHASGMLPMFAKLVGVDMYNDYTDYQNTTVRQYYDLDGNAVSELKNSKGEAVKADTSYAFNAEIQKTKDAKTAANNYLKWCAQRHPVYDGNKLVGYATFNPKFSSSPYGTDFTRHENYYKLLEDFNTYDNVTEASTVQGAVTMNFPSEENRLTEQQMVAYKQALRDTGIFSEKDIEKYAKKADMTFKEIIDAEVGNRANYSATQMPKWESTVKEVEAKLQKDYARKKTVDNSSLNGENGLKQKGGSDNDNGGIRKGTAEDARNRDAHGERATADGGKNSGHAGNTQAHKKWGDQTASVRKRVVERVDRYIAESKNYDEVFDYLCSMVGATADDISASQLKKAIRQLSEELYTDATTMHPVIFEDRWGFIGGNTNQLRKGILDAAQVNSNTGNLYSSQQTDADYIRYDRRAILKESKVDEYLMDYAAKSSPKYAQAYIAYVRPRTFLKLTTDDVFERYHIADQAGELDEEKLSNSRPGIYLRIDHETGEVTGHEGRHRMAAMDGAGIELVPVLLVDTSNKMTKTDIPEITLHGQFDETAMGIVRDLVPLNYENRDRVIKNFATQSSTQRIGERYGFNKTLRFSTQETDYSSNRHLLANAFEGITKSSIEYEKIQEYKGHIQELNKLEAKLHQLNAEIRKIRFGTEGVRDANRLRQLEDEAKDTAKEINRHDRKLLSLEASAPLRKVIDRERKKEAQKTMDHVKQIQESKKIRAEQAELRRKIRKTIRDLDKILNRGNKKRNVKEDMQGVVITALKAADILFTENYGSYDMLRNGIGADLSDAEEALVATCTQMLRDIDRMPTDGYDSWQARQEAEKQLNTKMSKLKDVFIRERKRLNNTTVSSILGELADAYDRLQESEQSYVQGAYSEAVHNFLKSLQSEVGGTIVSDMTKDQLEAVYAGYRMVLTTVQRANTMFNEELKFGRDQLGNAVIAEVIKAGGVHELWTKGEIARNQALWNNMKPIWVANRIGSETFGKLMQGLFKGQYNFAVDIDEARKFKLEMDKKYKPRNWDTEKQYEFESSTGKKFSLNLQQIMSLYAFSKREQAFSHLLSGGFVFEGNSTVIVDKKGFKKTYIHKGATSYKLNDATLNEIVSTLTTEQRAYVDEMQKYLSDVMGGKGNEVSMKLYGIKMFNEEFYFPLRSSGAYMERAKEAEMKKEQGQINLVNSGFTHAVKPQAKNPIILSGFMDVWAEHCNEMSMYHSMVLPMEDFRKVYNYSTVHDENFDSASVFQTIQDAYGDAATGYIDQLYRELNAGATIDPRESDAKARISKFKKAAVMMSASVVVQQFSAIGRAYAMIDPKYFIGTKVNSGTQMSAADEMKKYAPVAILKDIGGFDTGTKGSAKSYIMAEKYGEGEGFFGMLKDDWGGKFERLKGLKDEQYRSDIMGFLPAKADEITWSAIWEAVKRETKAKNPNMDVKSEEFLKMAGERFSEIIEKTQVYDSVLARSANMRSKGALMSMATAFMAEPTTTVNLLEDAIRKGNKKYIARAFGAVAASIVLNNALASVVYAMRDDDEDETFIEKYLQSLASGMIDDINPMSYYPFLKDVYSLLQGYDVERADMSVIADLRDAMKKAVSVIDKYDPEMGEEELVEYWKRVGSVMLSLLDAGCSMFGVPLKNVRRDVSGMINAYTTVHTDLTKRDTTWMSFWDKVGSAAKDTIPIYAWTKDASKAEILWEAIMAEDHKYVKRIRSTYKTDDAYHNAVIKQLQLNEPRIHDAAQASYDGDDEEYKRIFREVRDDFEAKGGIVGFNAIMSAVNNELSDIKESESGDSASSDFSATDYVAAIIVGETSFADVMREDILAAKVANGKTQEEAEESFAKSVAGAIRTNYESKLLKDGDVEEMLVEYADMDEEEAAGKASYWAFCKKYPQYKDLSEERVGKYYDNADPAGIPIDVYFQYYSCTKDMETIYNKWGREVKSRRDQILEFIDSLPLTSRQKDVLYLDAGYKESTLWKAPW